MPAPATLDLRPVRRAPWRPSATPGRRPGPPDPVRHGRLYATLAVAALAVAALSLVLSAAPSYDPWAWIVWGREVLHGNLVTVGGPTWKPLPVLLTTAFAGFGSAAPDLWLLVARAAGLFGVALAVVLAVRLTPRAPRPASAVLAAALTVAGVVLLSGYVDSVASGESEGVLLSAVTLAVLRHLDGAPRQALGFGLLGALIRPETWPFLILYAVRLWRRDPGSRTLVAAALMLIPVLWFGPELWGAHSALRGVQWAQHARPGSPAFASCPFCAELTGHAWPLLAAPFKLGVLLLAGMALAGARVPSPGSGAAVRRPRAVLATVAALAGAWIVEEAALTQTGFSGSDRYLIVPVALLIVLGAVGWGTALDVVSRSNRPRPGIAVLLATLLGAVFLPGAQLAHLSTTVARQRAGTALRAEFAAATRRAGGPSRLLACGPVQTNPSEAPLAAWTLGTQLRSTESSRGTTVIRSRALADATLAPSPPPAVRGYRVAARDGGVTIYVRACARPATVYGVRLARASIHT